MKKKTILSLTAVVCVLAIALGLFLWFRGAGKLVYAADGFYIYSDAGFAEGDIAAISQLPGVALAEGVYGGDLGLVVQDTPLEIETLSLNQRIRDRELLSGRLPASTDEVLVNQSFALWKNLTVGQVLPVDTEALNRDSIIMLHSALTITGICDDGSFDHRLYLLEDNYRKSVYAFVHVYVEPSSDYHNLDDVSLGLESIRAQRQELRHEELTSALSLLIDQKQKLAEYQMTELTQWIAQAEIDLEADRVALEAAKKTLDKDEQAFRKERKELRADEKDITETEADLESTKNYLIYTEGELDTREKALQEWRIQLDADQQSLSATLSGAGVTAGALDGNLASVNEELASVNDSLTEAEITLQVWNRKLSSVQDDLAVLYDRRSSINERISELKGSNSLSASVELVSRYSELAGVEREILSSSASAAEAKLNIAAAERTVQYYSSQKASLEEQQSFYSSTIAFRDRLAADEAAYASAMELFQKDADLYERQNVQYFLGREELADGKESYATGAEQLSKVEQTYRNSLQTYTELEAHYEDARRTYNNRTNERDTLFSRLEDELNPIRQRRDAIAVSEWIISRIVMA